MGIASFLSRRKMMFDAAYFDTYDPPYIEGAPYWTSFFSTLADYIVLTVKPVTVLDVGCAKGFLVAALRARDVIATGIDVSSYAIDHAVKGAEGFIKQQDAAQPLEMRYSLITCIEVLEHMPEAAALTALDNMCERTAAILFSSTPDDKIEPTYINVHPRYYWNSQFVERGFLRDARNEPTHLIPWITLWKSV
jgi:2-polyprenyl-3-methyl-5-hydroxy-6-metoxy-1,4-benzoquinol methylase